VLLPKKMRGTLDRRRATCASGGWSFAPFAAVQGAGDLCNPSGQRLWLFLAWKPAM
jgi:hypothetical protein